MARHLALMSLLLGACLAVAWATPDGQQVEEVTLPTETKLAKEVTLPTETLATPQGLQVVTGNEALAAEPEDEESATSILLGFWDILSRELHTAEHQPAIAVIFLLFGLLLWADSRTSICQVVVAANMVLAFVFTQSEVSSLWDLELRDRLCYFAAAQVAFLVGWATFKGMEGMLLIVLALLGAVLGRVAQAPLTSLGLTGLQDTEWCIVLYYSVFVWFALGLYKKNRHRHILALLCSVLGGALIVTSIAWGATFCSLKWGHSAKLQPVGGDWADFLQMLLTPGSRDVGLFAASTSPYHIDIIASRVAWAVLSVFGVLIQFQNLKLEKAGAAKAREGLLEQLLVSEV